MTSGQQRIALVTGAASGIGRQTALRLARDHHVVVADTDEAGLRETAALVTDAGGDVLVRPADVSSEREVTALVEACASWRGSLSSVCSAAGTLGPVRPLVELDTDAFDRVVGVNQRGVWLVMKHTTALLERAEGAAIVNIASSAALGAAPQLIAYGASKHAVVGLTLTAAVELAPLGIRVNAICPGPIDTAMMAEAERGYGGDDPGAARDSFTTRVPLERYGQPEEIAAVAAFLLSDEAGYITGSVSRVDGGMTAHQ